MHFLISFIGYVDFADTFKIIHDNEISDLFYSLPIYTRICWCVLILFNINFVRFIFLVHNAKSCWHNLLSHTNVSVISHSISCSERVKGNIKWKNFFSLDKHMTPLQTFLVPYFWHTIQNRHHYHNDGRKWRCNSHPMNMLLLLLWRFQNFHSHERNMCIVLFQSQ